MSGSNDCKIKVWSASTGECVRTLVGHESLVRALSFEPKSGRLVSASYDRSIKIWDLKKGECVLPVDGNMSLKSSAAGYLLQARWSESSRTRIRATSSMSSSMLGGLLGALCPRLFALLAHPYLFAVIVHRMTRRWSC